MPRSGWREPVSDRRLSDLVSVGLLTRVFPPAVVDEVIAGVGRVQVRHRSLPARVMAYFAIGMALYADSSYEEVLSALTDGLSWSSGWSQEYPLPTKSAIFQARARLGAEPMEALFTRVATPLATPGMPGAWLAGRRLVAVDGTCLDVADTPANDAHFGRAGVSKGERAAFPMARVLALAECGTHAIFAARVGAYTTSEAALATQLLPAALSPGMLLLADRGFFSYALWRTAAGTGADLLWRARTGVRAPHPRLVQELPDGSWLAHLAQTHSAAARREDPLLVRVIDYTLNSTGPQADSSDAPPEVYRLFTTMLDPHEAPAEQLAAAYVQRWEIETAFAELKTHQRGPRVVLRSKSPDLVHQEIWGHLCCHYAIRTLMTSAADHAGHDPDRLSFTTALRIVRHTIAHAGDFPPSRP